jgi:hypothetical protein
VAYRCLGQITQEEDEGLSKTIYTIEATTDPQEGYRIEAAFTDEAACQEIYEERFKGSWWYDTSEITVYENAGEYRWGR